MSYLNSKTNKYLFVILIITSFFIAFIFYLLTNLNHSDKLLNRLENALTTTKNLFEEQKRYALSLSILLSEDKELLESFIKNNREATFEIVNKKIDTLKQLQNSNFEVQIHNLNLTTYLRSWDLSIKDIPLESFRQGLVKVKESKKPLVSIELGKRLNIKAISPLIKDEEFIGSLETIIDFKYLSNELKQKGYKLFVLLDKKYLNIATQLTNNETIADFIIVNDSSKMIFENLDLKNLNDYGYVSNDKYSFSYFSYYDFNGNFLGYIFTAIENKNHLNFNNSYDYETVTSISKVQIK